MDTCPCRGSAIEPEFNMDAGEGIRPGMLLNFPNGVGS